MPRITSRNREKLSLFVEFALDTEGMRFWVVPSGNQWEARPMAKYADECVVGVWDAFKADWKMFS